MVRKCLHQLIGKKLQGKRKGKNMFNDKILKSVAEAVKAVVDEALKGDQHKIDKNKNGKVDAHDFKLLRKEEAPKKPASPFDWKNTPRQTAEKGEKTGHTAKKISTGTVYTKKYTKEEASQEEFNKEIKIAQDKSMGKSKAQVAKPAVQAVKQESVEQIREGRPSQSHPLEGHDYHKKTDAELKYIAKDAHEAAEAMKSHNTTAENKYRDQANDSATVRYWRQKNGMPSWYKKKYDHIKEEVEQIVEISTKTLARAASAASDPMKHYDDDETYHDPQKFADHAKKTKDAKSAAAVQGAANAKGHYPRAGHSVGVYDKLAYRAPARVTASGKANKQDVKTLKKNIRSEGVEHIEERSLSTGEKAAMEKNVKGMKKNIAGFKERYGKDAKSVMYATAAKQAKGE
jgi:hypothetical protein